MLLLFLFLLPFRVHDFFKSNQSFWLLLLFWLWGPFLDNFALGSVCVASSEVFERSVVMDESAVFVENVKDAHHGVVLLALSADLHLASHAQLEALDGLPRLHVVEGH